MGRRTPHAWGLIITPALRRCGHSAARWNRQPEGMCPMPTKRTKLSRPTRSRITPRAVAAWKAADFGALHSALGLKPWECSPLPREITALGVSRDEAVNPNSVYGWEHSKPQAIELQRQL